MKRLLSVAITMFLMIGVAFADIDQYVGVWTLAGVEYEGQYIEAEDLGVDMTIMLCADGSCRLESGNVSKPEVGRWEKAGAGVVVYDGSNTAMQLTAQRGQLVSVDEHLLGMKMFYQRVRISGDVDGNGKVDEMDAICTLRFGAGEDVTIGTFGADVDYNGIVDIRDALRIFQHAAGWNVELD